MSVYTFDPLDDGRWGEFVTRHPAASIFHTPGWLKALHQTYGYEPIVYTTSPPEAPLGNGVLLCRVRSWLTGRRLVSVPFADHCEPLVTVSEDRAAILASMCAAAGGWKYLELRPRDSSPWEDLGLAATISFAFHALDRLGALSSTLTYLRSSGQRRHGTGWACTCQTGIVARMPDGVLIAAGKLLYRHIG